MLMFVIALPQLHEKTDLTKLKNKFHCWKRFSNNNLKIQDYLPSCVVLLAFFEK